VKIDKYAATTVLLEAAKQAEEGMVDDHWKNTFESFSKICQESTLTHIAFLGTALLAKSVDVNVDVWAVKARNGGDTYSARGLGHGVLVPNAPKLGISLGVTGKEPMNNQPYFQIDRVSRKTTVHGNAKKALSALCDILESLERIRSLKAARAALSAFIYVRRQWNPLYSSLKLVSADLDVEGFIRIIEQYVREDSEGGKRAQAATAGILDIVVGTDRVQTTRINDPDRRFPGDVGILVPASETVWEKIFEVRDKRVEESDLYHFAQKAADNNVGEAAIVAVATGQQPLDDAEPRKWAAQRSVSICLFIGWGSFVRQALFWAPIPSQTAVQALPQLIFDRLVKIEVSVKGTERWRELTAKQASILA
jgi:hypothetical protein